MCGFTCFAPVTDDVLLDNINIWPKQDTYTIEFKLNRVIGLSLFGYKF